MVLESLTLGNKVDIQRSDGKLFYILVELGQFAYLTTLTGC